MVLAAGSRDRFEADDSMSRAGAPATHGSRGLTTHVVSQLGQAIVAGEIPIGSLLQPDAMSAEFAVSRTVVREALRVLQHKGLVAALPRAGTKVLENVEWNTLDPQVISWRSTVDATRQGHELMEMRRAIEPLAAALAARRADDALRSRVSESCRAMQRALVAKDRDAFERADVRFHDAVLVAAGNSMIAQIAHVVAEALHLLHAQEASVDKLDPRALVFHAAVTEAVVAGDPERAHAAMIALVGVAEARAGASKDVGAPPKQ